MEQENERFKLQKRVKELTNENMKLKLQMQHQKKGIQSIQPQLQCTCKQTVLQADERNQENHIDMGEFNCQPIDGSNSRVLTPVDIANRSMSNNINGIILSDQKLRISRHHQNVGLKKSSFDQNFTRLIPNSKNTLHSQASTLTTRRSKCGRTQISSPKTF